MRILFLGPNTSPICRWLLDHEGCKNLVMSQNKVTHLTDATDFIISHGYRHIIPASICERFQGRAINCHISLLPWNRGAHPNFWSWVDETPKGVSIHEIDEGVDTGRLLAQGAVAFGGHQTLKSTYDALQSHLLEIFKSYWVERKLRRASPKEKSSGTYHTKKEFELVKHLLPNMWETTIEELGEIREPIKDICRRRSRQQLGIETRLS